MVADANPSDRELHKGTSPHSGIHALGSAVISIFFPVEAPLFAMRSLGLPPLVGGPATSLINFIESWGRVRGGAFPSGHVLGSFVVLLGAWCCRRQLFWVFLPCFIAMCVSTIYGGYHYIADILAGILVGAVAFILAKKLMAVTGEIPPSAKSIGHIFLSPLFSDLGLA
jgi:membrane-associated phospholipid phosphatase